MAINVDPRALAVLQRSSRLSYFSERAVRLVRRLADLALASASEARAPAFLHGLSLV